MGSPAQPRPVEPAAPRSPFDFPQGERPPGHLPSGVAAAFTLRRPQGERTPRPRADHSSRGICANGLPCPTPVTLRQAQGERFPWSCACHSSRALGSTASPASPLWIPAFAGKTMGVCGLASADGVGGGGPAVAGRAFRERPLRRGWRLEARVSLPWVVGRPRAASVAPFESLRTVFDFPQCERPPPPLWIRAFGGMTRVGDPSTGSGRTGAPPSPAFAGAGSNLPQSRGKGFLRRPLQGPSTGSGRTVAPAPHGTAPALDTGFRRYDDGGVGLRLSVGFHVVLGVEAYLVFGVGDVPELPGVVGDAEVGGGPEGVGGYDAALD